MLRHFLLLVVFFSMNNILPSFSFSTSHLLIPLSQQKWRPKLNMALSDHMDILNDMIVVSLSNGISDGIAQFAESSSKKKWPSGFPATATATATAAAAVTASKTSKTITDTAADYEELESDPTIPFRLDLKRTRRFLIYGFCDGLVIHNWLIILEYLIKTTSESIINVVGPTVERVALDQLIFTPFWCIWFISCMTFISRHDGTSLKSLRANVKGGYMELLLITWSFFLPVSIFVYSSVPFESRVMAFSIANILYTILTSLWSQIRLNDAATTMVKGKSSS